jgi:polyisoprenoid-binding protein YceI
VKRTAARAVAAFGALGVLLALAGGPARAGEYRIDPTHTTVHVEIDSGLSTWRVRFNRPEGQIDFDRSAKTGRVDVSVAVAALDSGAPSLNALLRGATVLDGAAHERIRFAGDGFVFDGDRVSAVNGTLSLKGRSHALALKAQRFDCYTSPLFRREVCGGDFEAVLDRAALGIGEGRAVLRVQVEALKM